MANSIETNSTESGKAKALDKSVQKSANASTQPFKKIKKLSTGASTPPIYSCSSTTVSSSSDSQSDGSKPEAIELTPQEALEALQKHWRSPIYTFFKSEVVFQYHKGRPSHFFACAAPKCKYVLVAFVDTKIQRTSCLLQTSNTMPYAVLEQMQLTLL
ncbi:hypothetical protein V8E52_007775 [Russula decolorans]